MAEGVKIDTISLGGNGGGISANGAVAERLMQSGFNVNSLRTMDVLRKDEWKQFDNVLVEVARQRLSAVQELTSRGLVTNISNGLGTTILEWEQVSDMEAAEVSMAGVTPGQQDTLEFTLQSMPLPIIHKDFSLNIRRLQASRTRGEPLDTAQASMAARLVAEQVESMVFNGHATRVGSSRIYGLTTEGNRNTGSAYDWSNSATTGDNKLDDVISMINQLKSDNMFGPYGIWVSESAHTLLAEDFKTNSDKSQMQRLMEVPGIEFIKPNPNVTDSHVIMQQLTKDVAEEVIALQPTIVQWDSNGGMTKNFKVMAIMIPRVRSTVTGQSGIAHFT